MRDEKVWEFKTKEEANIILQKAKDVVKRYGRISVAEIDNMIFGGYSSQDFTIGWRDLSYAFFRPLDDIYNTYRYRLVIPNPVHLYGD